MLVYVLDLFFLGSLLVVNELFVLHSCSCTYGHNCCPAAEKTNKVHDYYFLCHCENMGLTNLMAAPFSSLSCICDVAWTMMEVSHMRTEGDKDEQSRGFMDGAKDGQS